jgi:hypothetical protein
VHLEKKPILFSALLPEMAANHFPGNNKTSLIAQREMLRPFQRGSVDINRVA